MLRWLVANEDYWAGRPYLDEVVFRYYGSVEIMLMALQKGEIDAFGNEQIPVHALKEIEADPNIKVEIVDEPPQHLECKVEIIARRNNNSQ
ncbi:hypothetical protein ES703_60081 [subsurface metagenome]